MEKSEVVLGKGDDLLYLTEHERKIAAKMLKRIVVAKLAGMQKEQGIEDSVIIVELTRVIAMLRKQFGAVVE